MTAQVQRSLSSNRFRNWLLMVDLIGCCSLAQLHPMPRGSAVIGSRSGHGNGRPSEGGRRGVLLRARSGYCMEAPPPNPRRGWFPRGPPVCQGAPRAHPRIACRPSIGTRRSSQDGLGSPPPVHCGSSGNRAPAPGSCHFQKSRLASSSLVCALIWGEGHRMKTDTGNPLARSPAIIRVLLAEAMTARAKKAGGKRQAGCGSAMASAATTWIR
jgi:hypothetical protein